VDAPSVYAADRVRPSVLAIAAVFARISATAFGGGQMGAIRREIVRVNRWLDEEEFLELLSIAQLLPGANPTNVAVLVGSRLRGASGAAAALIAAVLPGFAILMVLAAVALGSHLPAVTGALTACAAVAVGLTLANAIEMTLPRRTNLIEMAIVAAVAVSVLVLHLSLVLTLVLFIPLALLLTRPAAKH
jgi:chromate transporter